VTISSAAGGTQSQQYGFSGICSSTSPACSTAVTFPRLIPGSWRIQDSLSGASCQKQVTAGSITTATIRIDVGSCQ
jgi:hypothetical protein